MWKLFNASLIGVLGLGICSIHSERDLAIIAPSKLSALAEITGRFQDREFVRVIVDIDAGQKLPDPHAGAEIAARRRISAKAQADLLDRHVGTDHAKVERWAVRRIETLPMLAMTVTATELDTLVRDPHVRRIWPDQLHKAASDRMLQLIGMTPDQNNVDQGAWVEGATGAGTTIAVLDTGVDGTHPILAGKVVAEACFSTTNAADKSTSLCPNGASNQVGAGAGVPCTALLTFPEHISPCLHGTKIAGLAAGKNASGTGPLGGVAREATIFSIQVYSRIDDDTKCFFLGPLPSCLRAYTSDILAALSHVSARVGTLPQALAAVNLSALPWFFPDPDSIAAQSCDSHPLKAAIDVLRSQGVPTTMSSGSGGLTSAVGQPACISSVVAVATVGNFNEVAGFTAMGNAVDVLAYDDANLSVPIPGGGYSSGTDAVSFATAEVAGAFAAIKSRIPSASIDQIEVALKATGFNITDTRPANALLNNQPPGSLTKTTESVCTTRCDLSSARSARSSMSLRRISVSVVRPEVRSRQPRRCSSCGMRVAYRCRGQQRSKHSHRARLASRSRKRRVPLQLAPRQPLSPRRTPRPSRRPRVPMATRSSLKPRMLKIGIGC